ncbi:retention module-containing protein, partial [Zoogloea dura]
MATTPSPAATTNAVAKGTVVFVQGEAYLRDTSGKLTAIKPGDVVVEGQEIVTQAGAVVELQLANGAKLSVGPERTLLLNDELFATTTPERSENAIASSLGAEAERVIQALNSGADPFDNLEDPAAGLAGGGVGDQTHDFIRLARILEDVTPLSYTYTSSGSGVEFLPAGGTLQTVNTPPVATNDEATVAEDQPAIIDVLANDTDANGDALIVTSANAPNGQVTINPDGSLRYVPNPDFSGTDRVTYTISDGKGGTSSATVIINVTPVNDAPVANPDAATTPEDTPITLPVLVNDTDPEGDPLTITNASVEPGKGTVTINPDGTLTYTPAPDYNGQTTITYTVSDGKGGTSTTTVTVNVTPVNDPPVARPDAATTPEDTPVTVSVLGNDSDPEGNPLTVTGATVDPGRGSVTVNPDGTLSFTPAPNYNGPAVITYTISDGQGGTATSTVTINVTPVNDPAQIGSGAGTTQEDTVLLASGTLSITDPDAGEAGFQPQSATTGTYGTFSLDANGRWIFTLDNSNPLVQGLSDGDSRTETFTVRSIDGTESSVVITILGRNESIGAPGVGIVREDTVLDSSGTLTASGGASFVPQASTPGTYGSFSLNPNGTWTYTLDNPSTVVQSLAEGETRTETFPVTLSDGSTSTVTITVVGTNDPAIVDTGAGTVTEDTVITTGGILHVVDPDNGQSSFQPQSNAIGSYGSFNVDAAGNWTYTLDNSKPEVQALKEGETLSETFPVQTADGTPTTVTITVVGTNDGPTAVPDTASTFEDTPVTFPVLGNDTDPDGDTLTVTGASVDPAKGTVTVNPDGTLTFNPAPNYNGPAQITYTVSDGHGGTSTTTVDILVRPVGDPAQLSSDAGTVKEDTPAQTTASGVLSITDPDAGEAVFQAQTGAPGTYGSFSVDTAGNWAYTLDNANPVVQALKEGETRTEVFTVKSADGTPTTVTLTVIGTNDGPTAVPDSASTDEDTPVTFPVLGNDTDPDGDTLTVTGASVDPAKGSVTVNP